VSQPVGNGAGRPSSGPPLSGLVVAMESRRLTVCGNRRLKVQEIFFSLFVTIGGPVGDGAPLTASRLAAEVGPKRARNSCCNDQLNSIQACRSHFWNKSPFPLITY
jgi:hypothetical protein